MADCFFLHNKEINYDVTNSIFLHFDILTLRKTIFSGFCLVNFNSRVSFFLWILVRHKSFLSNFKIFRIKAVFCVQSPFKKMSALGRYFCEYHGKYCDEK